MLHKPGFAARRVRVLPSADWHPLPVIPPPPLAFTQCAVKSATIRACPRVLEYALQRPCLSKFCLVWQSAQLSKKSAAV